MRTETPIIRGRERRSSPPPSARVRMQLKEGMLFRAERGEGPNALKGRGEKGGEGLLLRVSKGPMPASDGAVVYFFLVIGSNAVSIR